ncbi:MAG TPA: site-specific DNA-methyltransferase [Anaerolineae bacterium]|nr:site-specific DNA-methyltransferase [Anaerolineae bacterium]
MSKRNIKSTSTSSFGSPGRVSHDSSPFYNSRLYQDHLAKDQVDYIENSVPEEIVNRLFLKSSEDMSELPDHSIQLMVTSPPYNVSKEYDHDLTLDEYLDLLHRVLSETYRVLVTGGRACINIANLGRKPYLPLHAFLIEDMLRIGFLMRGEIIWNKASSASQSTAWGSWLSASNPVLRDVHEYILVFSKDSFSRAGQDRQSTIEKDDFLSWTKSVWEFPAVSARKVGHPAPFPEELPRRLIELYTFNNDVVLDPFCGSGTTCLAAYKANRHYIGYEINQEYILLAENRLEAEKETHEHSINTDNLQPSDESS